MSRVALDSNVLLYAELEPDSEKGSRSADLIVRAARDGIIAIQVLGEFLRVVQRRVPQGFERAIRQVSIYQSVFFTPPTTIGIIVTASGLARAHGIQFWDCVVCAASAFAGAKALLTEDMQDRRMLDGVELINPFEAANYEAIDALLTP